MHSSLHDENTGRAGDNMLNSMRGQSSLGGVKESMVGSLPIGHPDYNAEMASLHNAMYSTPPLLEGFNSMTNTSPRPYSQSKDDELYILKSQIIPPVCPKCPTKCDNQGNMKKCAPCPSCDMCPNPLDYQCKKV